MKVTAIVQARMGSTRLPGKVMKTINGKPLLQYQLERVIRSSLIDQVIVATTFLESDEPIINLCEEMGVDYYRGSEQDVLSRYYEAAKQYHANVIIRLTSDCPLIDPIVIDNIISYYIQHKDSCDYVSNVLERSFPRGYDVEVFSFKTLRKAYYAANLQSEREHVTPYIYMNPEEFKLLNFRNIKDFSNHRWTVDTIEDFELIKRIILNLYCYKEDFNFNDVIKLLDDNPDWFNINAHIEQKKL